MLWLAKVLSASSVTNIMTLPLHTAPLLLGLLIGLLLSLLTWSRFGARRRSPSERWPESRGDFLVALLVLAAFGLGLFVSYVLFCAGL